jgi:glycosyltransferase involved in cell wall biosynthesis
MKILMGIPAPWLKGGPPTHLPLLVEYLEKETEFEIKTFYFGSQKRGGRESFLKKIFQTLKTLLKFVHLIVIFRPHVIHLNSAFDRTSLLRDIPFSLISKLARRPLLFKVHGSHNELLHTKNYILVFLIRIYFWGATKIGVLSELEKEEFIEHFGNAFKLIVVKNIVKGTDNRLLKKEKINTKFDGLFVSRIEKGKGLEDLLEALQYVIKINPSFILAIAGDGKDLKQSKRLAEELNIQSNIEWLGYIQNNELKNIYAQSKIFVFTSHFPEGMPMSMVEALLHGMPIITTKTRFAISYLKEEENVLFIESHQPKQIAEKIIYLMNNIEIQNKMRKENNQFVQLFSQEKVGIEFSRIYNQMANPQLRGKF